MSAQSGWQEPDGGEEGAPLLPPQLPPWATPRPRLEATGPTAPGLHVLGAGLGVGTGGVGCFRGPGLGAGVSVGYGSETTGCGEGSRAEAPGSPLPGWPEV